MGAHRSLGEFSIEKAKDDLEFDKFILKDEGSNDVRQDGSIELKSQDELKEESYDKKISFDNKLYAFPDFLAVVFSYLFFLITSSYLSKVELADNYKQNGQIVLFAICLVINGYYLISPFFKKTLDVLDKILFFQIASILISGIYYTVTLLNGDVSPTIFKLFFFIGSIVYIFDSICFRAGLCKINEDLDVQKDYLVGEFVNVASSSSLQSATTQKKPLAELKRNDLVYIKVNDVLPFDGEVMDGEAIVQKRIYAGEAETNILTKKVYAFAGSKILNGELIVRVDNLWEDSFIYDNISRCQEAISENQKILTRKEFISFFVVVVISFVANFLYYKEITASFCVQFLVTCLLYFSFLRIFIIKDAFLGFVLKRAFSDNILLAKRSILNKFLSVKNYVLDFVKGAFSKDFCVSSFKLYDERIDESYLLEALFSIFAKSDTPIFKKLNSFIAKNQRIVKAYKLEEYMEYSDLNVVSFLSGTRFIVGEEAFMIEMKVQAQESDFMEEKLGQKMLYVALNDMIVGCFTLNEEFMPSMEKLVSKVNLLKCNFYITSKESESLVDDIGKRAGVGIANVFGGLTPKTYSEKMQTLNECVFFSNLHTDNKVINEATYNVGVFDPVLCETEDLDAVIFGDNLSSFGKIVDYVCSYKKFLCNFFIYFVVSLILLISLSFNLVYLIFGVFILTNLFLNIFRFRTSRLFL